MKKNLLFILFVFSVQQVILAQPPGYQGKRLSLGYYVTGFTRANGVVFTALPGYASDIYVNQYSTLNVAHNFNLDYVVSRNAAIGITVEHFRSGVEFAYKNGSYYQNHFANIVSNWVLFNEKTFGAKKNGTIAPLGLYNQFSIGIGSAAITDVKNAQTNKPDPSALSLLGPTDPLLAFFYETGFQKIITSRLMLTAAMRFGLISSFITYTVKANLATGETLIESNQREFNQQAIERLFRYQFLNLHLGLSYILF